MEPYTPQFYEDVHFYPPFKQDGRTPNDGSYRSNVSRRQFATPDTAEWVGREFGASRVFPRPYLGGGEAFDVNEQPVQQYAVTIGGVDMTAGEIAYYFTIQDPALDHDAGMWPADLPYDQRMKNGKEQADKWVQSSIQHTDVPS